MKAHLKALYDQLHPNLTKHGIIDLWNNQLTDPEQQPPGDLDGSIFFRFQFDMKSTGKGMQRGDGFIEVHIGKQSYTSTEQGAKDDDGYDAFLVLAFVDAVHALLQGFSGRDSSNQQLFTSLDRISMEMDEGHQSMYHIIMRYSTTITDRISLQDRNTTTVSPVAPDVVYENPIQRN